MPYLTTGPVSKGNYVVIDKEELVTNGTFDSDLSGWSKPTPERSTISWDAGRMKIDATSGNGIAPPVDIDTISLIVGEEYVITWFSETTDGATANGYISGSINKSGAFSIGLNTDTFTAVSSSLRMYGQANKTVLFDNISVKEIPSIDMGDMMPEVMVVGWTD